MPRPRSALSKSLPAPIGGWNTRDPLPNMPPQDAVRLVNVFPDTAHVELRNGFAIRSTSLGTKAVETVAEFSAADGTRKLIGCANNQIYDASIVGAHPATSLGSGFTTNRWQTVNFRAPVSTRLIMVNGSDVPQLYDGTSLSVSSYSLNSSSGSTFNNPNDFINVNIFKNRVYFVIKNSTSVAYLDNVEGFNGSYSVFDFGTFLQRGGYIVFAGSWTRDSSITQADLFVVATNMGEILTYAGNYPGDPAWSIIGRYYLPVPLNRRSFAQNGSDFVILNEYGLLPMSQTMNPLSESATYNQLSDKIREAFRQAVQLYRNNFGWQVIIYPGGRYTLVNVPTAEGSTAEQYVMNSLTGAWCKFTGMNAASWCLYNEGLYFGGMDGNIYQADTGSIDYSLQPITWELKTAFNYLGDISRTKRFTLGRPHTNTFQNTRFFFDIDTDFQDRKITSEVVTTGIVASPWDTSPWDTSPWETSIDPVGSWYSLSGIGRCASVRMLGSHINLPFSVDAFDIIYEPGGYI